MAAVASACWEDLGYQEKTTTSHFASYSRTDMASTNSSRPHFEAISTTEARRARCLSILDTLQPHSEIDDQTLVSRRMKFKGKAFDFYPSTDTYYIHSTNKYGTGIERLAAQILKHLL